MDLSFDGENNFNLPDPAGKLDFTEDEDRKNECAGGSCNEQCAGQCANEPDASMSDDQMNENESDIEDSSNNAQPIVEFSKPLVNQNLLLNKKPCAGSSRNPLFANRAPPSNAQTGMQEPVTPALIKRKQFKQWFNSPTDNCLSPCTQKIFKQKKAI